jgi:PAS domain S-box-containing protein
VKDPLVAQAGDRALLWEKAFAALPQSVVITDARVPDHPIVAVNRAFCALTGYAPEQVVGRNCRFLNANARKQAALASLRRAIQTGEACSVRLLNHRANGEAFWNQLSIAPLRDAEQRLTHFVGVLSESSAEDADDLEPAAQRKVAGADARDRLLTLISHELRSPMGAILAWAELLRDEASTSDSVRALDAIEAAVGKQMRLVDDAITAARLRSGAIGFTVAELDLRSAVGVAVERAQAAAREKHIALEAGLPAARADFLGDARRLEQMIFNLVDHATASTPEGGSVVVSLEDAGECWRIDVSGGPELSERALNDALDWMERPPEGRGRIGLALPIAKQLAERHGGALRAANVRGAAGATLRVELPKKSEPSR